ncbi:MAG: phage tail protein [Myxococcales bacterium]|nr:phage tail protein [Myxococcales bacterium]
MPTLELPALYADVIAAQTAPARPILINRDPGPGEMGVPLEWFIALEILDPGPDGIDRAETRVLVDGVLAFEGGGVPELKPGFDGPRATVVQTSDTLRVVLDPAVPFESQALVTVRVISATVGGAPTIDETYFFVAEDRTPPKAVGAQAVSPTIVRVGFDEDVLVTDPLGFVFEALDFPAVPVVPIDAVSDGAAVLVTLDTELTPDVRYRVHVTGVEDTKENSVTTPDDVAIFTGYRSPRPAGRRFDLWSMLPRHNRRSDVTGDLRRFIACLQEALDLLMVEGDRFSDVFDIERAPEAFLALILHDLGNPFPFDLEELDKRRLASVLVEMYRQKGTAIGIENAIRFFLGIDITAITPFAGTTLVLGESELGVDWELGPSDRFARYAFDVEVDIPLNATERSQIRAIVDYLKPAHTHFVQLIEPMPPVFIDHWELGSSELGETTELH